MTQYGDEQHCETVPILGRRSAARRLFAARHSGPLEASPVPWQDLRALLARNRITHRRFAAACELSIPYTSRLLTGAVTPGRLGRIQLERGMVRLGLDRVDQQEVAHVR
jgi:hypothetical protein